jgi:hypothetical protein
MSHVNNNDVVFPGVGNGTSIVAEELIGGKLNIQCFVEVNWEKNGSSLLTASADPGDVFDLRKLWLKSWKVIEADHVLQVVFARQNVLQIKLSIFLEL